MSDGLTAVGVCAENIAGCAKLVNRAQRRLVYARESGDAGWYGSWSKMVFAVNRTSPYLTLPRGVARIINLNVCSQHIPLANSFYEYLSFGIGPQGPCTCGPLQAYERNPAITFTDLTGANKKIRVYMTDANDAGRRVFVGGLDGNGNKIAELDNAILCQGTFLTLAAPFVDTSMTISELQSIQKEQTFGIVRFYSVDTVTGEQVLLLSMEPTEKVSGYPRYWIGGLPKNCCGPTASPDTIQISGLAKLDLIDVIADPDYLLIQNLEALCEEVKAIRYSEIDSGDSKRMAQEAHTQAIRLLQGELVHREGKSTPAIGFMLHERNSLQRACIGMT